MGDSLLEVQRWRASRWVSKGVQMWSRLRVHQQVEALAVSLRPTCPTYRAEGTSNLYWNAHTKVEMMSFAQQMRVLCLVVLVLAMRKDGRKRQHLPVLVHEAKVEKRFVASATASEANPI